MAAGQICEMCKACKITRPWGELHFARDFHFLASV